MSDDMPTTEERLDAYHAAIRALLRMQVPSPEVFETLRRIEGAKAWDFPEPVMPPQAAE